MRRLILVPLLLFMGCSGQRFDEAVWSEKGSAIIGDFKRQMSGALQNSMRDGASAGIEVCRDLAPEIAAAFTNDTREVGRTSQRLRNPDNAPREWIKPLLDEYAAADEPLTARALPLENGHIGYVEPIYVMSVCLKCHGSQIDSTISHRLAELYPQDQAKGYASGDFRGLFWVEFSGAE